MKKILLVGAPNSGKSTIFNLLSGKFRKVSNYAGVSVDVEAGELKSSPQQDSVLIVDMPGIYGQRPRTLDEGLTIGTMLGLNTNIKNFHQIAVVIDPSRMEIGLSLALTLKEIFGPDILVIINKTDLMSKQNIAHLVQQNLGLKTLGISALRDAPEKLENFLRDNLSTHTLAMARPFSFTQESVALVPFSHEGIRRIKVISHEEAFEQTKALQEKSRKLINILGEGVKIPLVKTTFEIDKVILHPIWGSIIFLAVFYLLFHALYTWSAPLMDWLDVHVNMLGELVAQNFSGNFQSLIKDGLFAGVGGVIVFLPQVMILFFLLSLLEQSGYIARAAFLADRVMSFFGLNGKAFLPFLSGFACSIPAIMSTRTIPDHKERMATIMTIPLITCSARLPVYILLVGTFIPKTKIFGFFNSQALALFFLYFLGSFVALVMAKIFRLSFFRGKSGTFFMEMPLYQRPSIKMALHQMKRSGLVFLKKAGTIIFIFSLVIWMLSSYPKVHNVAQENVSTQLEQSYIGKVGKIIEPVIKPLGYDWKMGVGILMAFGARELFVSGLGTIYALQDVDEESQSLRERLMAEKNKETGMPLFNLAVAWSLLIFFAFACQCMSTLAIVKKETGNWYWPTLMFVYMGVLAYGGAFITYRLVLGWI